MDLILGFAAPALGGIKLGCATYFSEWGLFTWFVLFASFLQIRFCVTTNGGVKITAIKHTQQKFKSNQDLLSRLLVAAEEDNSSDNDQNGWDCDDNANDGT